MGGIALDIPTALGRRLQISACRSGNSAIGRARILDTLQKAALRKVLYGSA
jgi:hypothetical protein